MNIEWIICPIGQRKTRWKIRGDTELKNSPLYCPKYRQETLINVQQLFPVTGFYDHRDEYTNHYNCLNNSYYQNAYAALCCVGIFYDIGNSSGISYIIKTLKGIHTPR